MAQASSALAASMAVLAEKQASFENARLDMESAAAVVAVNTAAVSAASAALEACLLGNP